MILGDRYEVFSVAIAAAMHNLPLIHLHGGEKTLGVTMMVYSVMLLLK
ncbi:hypothetical protein [Photobacterium leiognathi]|nr:hypothetical protein [Photobacterium leiognathi]